MSKFLKAMSKIGLVELSGEEKAKVDKEPDEKLSMADIDAILASDKSVATPPPKAAPSQPATRSETPRAATPSGNIPFAEGEPFQAIYADEGAPEASYSAEKLLRVLDGLKAMEPSMRKAAVLAMDAADDDWTVADAVLDAERKAQILHRRISVMASNVETMVSEAASEKTRCDQYLAEATATLRAKIAEIEKTLQSEAGQIAAQKAEIDGKLAAARHAFGREKARLEAEALRLSEIPKAFAVPRNA